jgi:hypothetical protein
MKHRSWMLLLVLADFVCPCAGFAGQFRRPVYYSVGFRDLPNSVTTADFRNNGNTDLAVADWLSGHVSILLGNGDGTFQKPIRFAVPNPIALAVGEFNEDGKPDLAVIEFGGTGHSLLALFLGEGNGKFRAGVTYELGIQSAGIALADFNGDGHLDVAASSGGEGKTGNVMIFFGTGKGTLKKPTTYKVAGTPGIIAAADLNGDKHPDLATVTAGTVAILLNDGTGKFLKPVTYNAGGGEVVDVKIADLRNDGRDDLVVANASQGMVVLLNRGDGTFRKPTIYPPLCQNCVAPSACVVADFNLDGKLDVACASNIDDSYFFYGDGKGSFGAINPIHDTIQNQGGFSIAAGDFNNDKAPDLAIPIQNYGKVAILLNTQ